MHYLLFLCQQTPISRDSEDTELNSDEAKWPEIDVVFALWEKSSRSS